VIRDGAFKRRDNVGDFLVRLGPDDQQAVSFSRLDGDCPFRRLLLRSGGDIGVGPADIACCGLDLGGSGRVLDDRFEFGSLACAAARADSWPELKDRARDPPRTGEQPSEARGKLAARTVVDRDQ